MKTKVHLSKDEVHCRHVHDDGSEAYFVAGYSTVAIAPNGRRWHHEHVFDTVEAADRFIERIEASGSIIDTDKPCWYEVDPVYGSEEYQRQGIEEQLSLREREDALIFGY